MELREIIFFKKFQCLASDCPETCCRGWIIPLEPEDRERFRKEMGLLKWKLLLATRFGLKAGFNASSATCPFQNKRGLCSLQLAKGHDFIPEACREYPRFYRNYGLWEERLIDLSCIAGAKLWFDHYRELTYESSEGEPVSGKDTTNEDEAYLQALHACRQAYIRALLKVRTAEELIGTLQAVEAHARKLQDVFLHADPVFGPNPGSDAYADSASVPDPAAGPYAELYAFNDELCKPSSSFALFPFGTETMQDIMRTHLFGERLSVANPDLYRLCKLYYNKGRKEFENSWPRLAADFLIRYERYAPYYASLFAYYLCQHFLRCHEDYSFVRNIRMGLIHLNVKFFFDVLDEEAGGSFTDEDFVRNVAVYNRRGYFNMRIQNEMYEVVSGDLFRSKTEDQ